MAREGKDDSIDKPSRNKMVLDLLQTPLDSTHLALVSAPPPAHAWLARCTMCKPEVWSHVNLGHPAAAEAVQHAS
jgi:hypothetical protein